MGKKGKELEGRKKEEGVEKEGVINKKIELGRKGQGRRNQKKGVLQRY